MMINAHKANKDYYGGETMPEGMRDCNSCGWYDKESNFKYGLCSSCGVDDNEDEIDYGFSEQEDKEYEEYLRMIEYLGNDL